MDPETLALIAARYRAVQDRAGVSLRCLDPEADGAPEPAEVEAGEDGAVTVRIQGPLDWFFGFDYRALIRDLDEAEPKSIRLLIESPGGFLSDGLALYADLRARVRDGVKVTAEARGVVASAAVLPFLAADERTMTTGTMLMIHDPWTLFIAAGTADEIEGWAEKSLNGLRAGEKSLRDIMTERTADRVRRLPHGSRTKPGSRPTRRWTRDSRRRRSRTRRRKPNRTNRPGPWRAAPWLIGD